jgi:two-component system response regulator RegA
VGARKLRLEVGHPLGRKRAEEASSSNPQASGDSGHESFPQGRFLLVESITVTRPRLLRSSAAMRSAGTVVKAPAAMEAACHATFAYVLIDVRFRHRNTLALVRNSRGRQSELRIVVITDHDSIVPTVMAHRARAYYRSFPAWERDLADGLIGYGRPRPPVSETPLGAERVRWEHIQPIPTPCGQKVSDVARRLRIHRRTLQRPLSKRAPYPRGTLQP